MCTYCGNALTEWSQQFRQFSLSRSFPNIAKVTLLPSLATKIPSLSSNSLLCSAPGSLSSMRRFNKSYVISHCTVSGGGATLGGDNSNACQSSSPNASVKVPSGFKVKIKESIDSLSRV